MSPGTVRLFIASAFICVVLLTQAALAQTGDATAVEVPEAWAATYTPEELAAIDRALWAANLTREDLSFKKDYTKGYQCFPIVRDMMADPLSIAADMDGMIAGIAQWQNTAPSPIAEVAECMTYYPWFSRLDRYAIAKPGKQTADSMNLEGLQARLTGLAQFNSVPSLSPGETDMVREYAPYNLSWHDVFDSPYPQEQRSTWEEDLKARPDDYIYQLMSEIDIIELGKSYMENCPDPRGWLTDLPADFWPSSPVMIETGNGRIGIGTVNDDTWEGDFTVLIEPGGNDHYVNCRIGAAYGTEDRRYGYFVDLGGNDFYDCPDVNINLGAAVLGIAAFYDLGQGNDRYVAGSCALGAAMCGIATFYDDGGTDVYEGKVYTQGAAGFGIGVMVDDSLQPAQVVPTDEETPDPIDITAWDNDRYHAYVNSQAFARTLGFAICSNKRGNEVYEAGGVYLHAPLFADRYQSFSQGFAIGERGIDYAGGIAYIIDYAGNDRYLGDVYNQGVGYWYSAGLMYDGAGNDTYEMTQYGQGSGIHLAIGGVVDVGGNDSYTMHSGLGTGGSHDFAASMLHDRGGNDQYFGNTSCNGGSLTNSAVIFIDRSGDDTYAGRRDGGINFCRPERGFTSIGVLVDLAGNDDYLGIMDNGVLWSHTFEGVGWDIAPPPAPEETAQTIPAAPEEEPNVALPEIIGYQGELNQEVFDELYAIAVRWEVGDNRYIVPHARERLIAFGPKVLPYLSEEFDNDQSGLAVRAFTVILQALLEQDREGVLGVLRTNLASTNRIRRSVALVEISDLKANELESQVALILDDPDPAMQRRAIGVLGVLGSHAADERLLANLDPSNDEALIKVSMETLFTLEVKCWDRLRLLLDFPHITVRETLIGKLAGKPEMYEQELRSELLGSAMPNPGGNSTPLNSRSLRSLLKIFANGELVPDAGSVEVMHFLLQDEDWGVRADAIKVVNHWEEMTVEPPAEEPAAVDTPAEETVPIDRAAIAQLIKPLVAEVEELLATETDPYVLFIGTENE